MIILNPKITLLLSDHNGQLNFIDLQIDNPIKKCEKAIKISLKSKEKLKLYNLKKIRVLLNRMIDIEFMQSLRFKSQVKSNIKNFR